MDVHEGIVTDVRTMQGGFIAPYLAVWTQPLREHAEQSIAFCDQDTSGSLTVTTAGATVGTVRNLSQAVVQALHRVKAPGGGEYRHTDPHVPIQYDTAISPNRFYQPLSFTFQQP